MIGIKLFFFMSPASQRSLVLSSDLFDEEWYALAHPYLVRDRIDPLSHFLKHGKKLRISPSRKFDSAKYLDQHEEPRNSRLNPLVHYLKYGRKKGLEVHPAPASDADRIRNSNLFDEDWYLDRYLDVAEASYPPLLHFLVHGAEEGRSPGPNFDSAWYLTQYPDIIGLNPLLHYIDHGEKEGRQPLPPGREYTQADTTLYSVSDLDPGSYEAFVRSENVWVSNGQQPTRTVRNLKLAKNSIDTTPRALVFLPWLLHGEADLVASHAIRALAEDYGAYSVLVIVADHDMDDAVQLLPPDVTFISFSRLDKSLSHNERIQLIDSLVLDLNPEVILNVNSHVAWEATNRMGGRLAKHTRLFAMLLRPDSGPIGKRGGYADLYLRNCLMHLEGVYIDNKAYVDELVEKFELSDELQSRLVTLYQPALSIDSRRDRSSIEKRMQVLWAGQLMPNNNFDLLIRIAELAPQYDFHIWGGGSHALETRLQDLADRCSHVHFNGPFQGIQSLPLTSYDAFLSTPLSGGIPNALLEAAGTKLPIIASNAGGISELVDEATGWLISELSFPEPYLSALETVASNPQIAMDRAENMRKRIRKTHNWKNYIETLRCKPESTKGMLYGASKNSDHI